MIAFSDRGRGEAVVFLHGFGLDGRYWAPQVEASGAGRTVVVDLPGFGPAREPASGVVCPAEAVREVLDACAIDRAHLVGHSFGVAVAVDLALSHPERVRSLTLTDGILLGRPPRVASWPSCRDFAERGDLEGARRAWLDDPLFLPARENPDVARALEEMVRDYGCAQWAGRLSHRWYVDDHTTRLRDVRAPTLLVYGERDTSTFLDMAQEYACNLADARLVMIAGAGHCASLENPTAFEAAAGPFFAELTA
jgi:3-oxoadipate enol-lactonase/2-succinyl-6-hydroxy-2,4-cyclohexadiene-1-carboxylate synthase